MPELPPKGTQHWHETRRALIKTIVVDTTVGLAFPGCGPLELLKGIFAGEDSPRGKFLAINGDNGEPIIMDRPIPAKVVFVAPQRSMDTPQTAGKIYLRREPSEENPDPEAIWPSGIKTEHAVRMFGNGYSGNPWGNKSILYKGQEYRGGIWFALSDEKGNFVTPLGRKLDNNEKPFYVAASFVTILSKEQELLSYNLTLLNPEAYYEGFVTIIKHADLGARKTPVVTESTRPTETNAISWDKIVAINGVNIEKTPAFMVKNPLLVEGTSPTGDPSRPSKWMAFYAEVIEIDEYGREVRKSIPLYINLSVMTKEHVEPDRNDWFLNLPKLRVVNDKIEAVDVRKSLPGELDIVSTSVSPRLPEISGK